MFSGGSTTASAPLARIELAASMAALLDRVAPMLRLAKEPKRKPDFVIRVLEGLRVEL